MTPEDLLAGPRGRRLCLELRRCTDRTEHAILKAFARSVDAAMYWQEPDDKDNALAELSARRVLLPVATALSESPHTTWWDSPLDADDQHVVDARFPSRSMPGPQLTGVRERISAALVEQRGRAMELPPHHVDWRTCSGLWWSSPTALGAVATTRSIGEFGPAELWLLEDSPDAVLAEAWRVSIARRPRVYEIATAADWIELVRAYPLEVTNSKRGDWWRTTGRDGRWLMPDWLAVVDDYDAVHLSALAYLTCAGVPLDISDDTATVLAGWHPDMTFWFDDLVQLAGGPTRWQRDRDEWTWHRGTTRT